MSLPTLEEMLANGCNTVRAAMQKHGEIIPMCIGHTASGELVPIACEFSSDPERKAKAVESLRELLRRAGVVSYVYIAEGWMVKRPHFDPDTPPSEDPDRQEIVAIIAASAHRALWKIYEIKRDAHGKFTGLAETKGDGPTVGGRFATLLADDPNAMFESRPAN